MERRKAERSAWGPLAEPSSWKFGFHVLRFPRKLGIENVASFLLFLSWTSLSFIYSALNYMVWDCVCMCLRWELVLCVLFALLVLVHFSYIGRDLFTNCNAYCCITYQFTSQIYIFMSSIQLYVSPCRIVLTTVLFLFRIMLTAPLLTDRPISLGHGSNSRPVGILLITQVGCAKVNG